MTRPECSWLWGEVVRSFSTGYWLLEVVFGPVLLFFCGLLLVIIVIA